MKDINKIVDSSTKRITLEITPYGLTGPKGKSQAIRTYVEAGLTYMQTGEIEPPATEPSIWNEPFRVTGPSSYEVYLKDNSDASVEDYFAFLKGEPFRYEDFTAEDKEGLKLKFSHLTEEEKDGLKLKFSHLTKEDKDELRLKFEHLTDAQKQEIKGEPFVYEDFTQDQLADLKGETGDMPIEALNEFMSNYYDEPIVNLHNRVNALPKAKFHKKLRLVQSELDNLKVKPELLTNMATTTQGKLQSVLPQNGLGDFTVERNSTATYVDKDGLIKTAAPNEPRIDWSTGEPMLLVEGGATNLIPWSEDFNQWDTVGSNGTQLGGELILTPSNDTIGIPATDVKMTLGSDENSRAGFGMNNPVFNTNNSSIITFYFKPLGDNVIDELIGTQFVYGVTMYTKNITPVKNGFYKFTGFVNNQSGTIRFQLRRGITQSEEMHFILSGVQLEEGTKATSYIPTSGAIATRLADRIYKENAQDLIGQSEGTIFFEVDFNGENGEYRTLTRLHSSVSDSERILITLVPGNEILIILGEENIPSKHQIRSGTNSVSTGRNKIAVKYNAQGVYIYTNGVNSGSNPSVPVRLNPTDMIFLGNNSGAQYFDSGIKDFKLYKEALSEEQCIALTTL